MSLQVLVVGDLNIAASQADVHDKLDREQMYSQDEKALFASLLAELTDVWRKLHPDTTKAYTVWDEKTSARAFNEVTRHNPVTAYCTCHVIQSKGMTGRRSAAQPATWLTAQL